MTIKDKEARVKYFADQIAKAAVLTKKLSSLNSCLIQILKLTPSILRKAQETPSDAKKEVCKTKGGNYSFESSIWYGPDLDNKPRIPTRLQFPFLEYMHKLTQWDPKID